MAERADAEHRPAPPDELSMPEELAQSEERFRRIAEAVATLEARARERRERERAATRKQEKTEIRVKKTADGRTREGDPPAHVPRAKGRGT